MWKCLNQLHEILRLLLLYIANICELTKIIIYTIGRKRQGWKDGDRVGQ